MLMNGQQYGQEGQETQDFYLDNLNLDTNEMSWGRSVGETPSRDPRAIGSRVSAFPDGVFAGKAPESAEAIPKTGALNPEILAPAPGVSPEMLNPAITTPRANGFDSETGGSRPNETTTLNPGIIASGPEEANTINTTGTGVIASQPEMSVTMAGSQGGATNKPERHESPAEFGEAAEVKLAQDGNIVDFYNSIRNYGEGK